MTARTPRVCVACAGLHRVVAFTATERLLGTLEPFEYWECPQCGCVQITRVPEDLARHYPEHYFAFKPQHRLAANRLRGVVDPARLDAALGRGTLPARLANRLLKPLDYAAWCKLTGLGRGARVLDIGCGSGKLLVRLRQAGFSRCLGVDPFVREPLHYANGVEVRRQSVFELAAGSEERFELVMAHHSLEHMTRPHEVLAAGAGGRDQCRVPRGDAHLYALLASGLSATVFGNHFANHALFWRRPTSFSPRVPLSRMGAIYARHRIALNVHAAVVREGTNMRTFECAAFGIAQVVEQRDGLDALFDPQREIVTYRHPDELAETLRALAADATRRTRLAMAARRRALAQHTYAHRVARLLYGVL